ncbi:hypothetical protein [Novosphingobium mangrovi (ex Hu et al. 2023)]|uniref:Uncharacterized protein n=1 Tax=Novosphingobium mangrovi (ex Hu et al. 2023) TaxID=2930094 RepID=A0ABT0AHN5_9SPHN|nr:hypothetical protein [Novosphingobium mangrovi (ex Hu et al. 2023)]MCJ1962690.1 hypothetical protein [Novosphingobium mangrovi (ex Hu et al. 2023)]
MKAPALFSLVVALIFTAPPVLAQEADASVGEEIIMNAWANSEDCNRDNATELSFSEVAADTDVLIGQCVSLAGYWYGRGIFRSEKDALRKGSLFKPHMLGKRIGLYANWEMIGDPPSEPRWQRIVGRVGRCETQWPGAMMVMGFCHYTGGPILLVSEVIFENERGGR